LKVSIIGCGTMGITYAKNLASMEEAELAGVCDVDAARAEEAAKAGGTAAYTDYKVMLEAENPEVVCVCLPTHLHKRIVIELAQLGKHIICEKPIGMTLEEADAMIEACRESGVRLFVGHVVRFFPNYADAAAQISRGETGGPGVAHLKRYGSFPKGNGLWYHDRSKSGGVILDLMIHDIDFVRSVYGEAKAVYALKAQSGGDDPFEYAMVTIRFRNGAIGNLTAYWGYPGPFTTAAEFAGNQGVLRLSSESSRSLTVIGKEEGQEGKAAVQVPQSPMRHDPYYRELKHFLACIRDGSEPLVTAEDARAALEIALAAELSCQTGQPVAIGGKKA
jgi:UDP-N-acetylglucosamine 3-dehydrogenase